MLYNNINNIYLIGGVFMTRLDQNTINAALKHLERVKVFTIEELVNLLKCSIPNARLKLRKWQTYTSYNQNGRFYVLPKIPKFDPHGIWHHKNVAFSRHGNLKKTVVHLVTTAPAGLTGKQLGDILGLAPQSFLHHFSNQPGIERTKYAGVYVYFSDDTTVYERQVQQRTALICQSAIVTISDPEAIMILVAIIRNHCITAEEIHALPEIKKNNIKLAAIQGFMESHELKKKLRIHSSKTP
jgi:hypothetical protein